MARATKQAIEATRESDAVVEFKKTGTSERVYVKWNDSIPFEADKMVRSGWLIDPSCVRNGAFRVYKTIN